MEEGEPLMCWFGHVFQIVFSGKINQLIVSNFLELKQFVMPCKTIKVPRVFGRKSSPQQCRFSYVLDVFLSKLFFVQSTLTWEGFFFFLKKVCLEPEVKVLRLFSKPEMFVTVRQKILFSNSRLIAEVGTHGWVVSSLFPTENTYTALHYVL